MGCNSKGSVIFTGTNKLKRVFNSLEVLVVSVFSFRWKREDTFFQTPELQVFAKGLDGLEIVVL